MAHTDGSILPICVIRKRSSLFLSESMHAHLRCEKFTTPDHDLDTQSDFCIFDNDIDAMLLAFD
jgi:hypothetical protein